VSAARTTAVALVLKVADHGESHRIVELLTRESGLKRVFAPAARRSTRRFGGALEPGTRIDATLSASPGRDLGNLHEASVMGGLKGALRSDLSAMLRAGWILDLTRALLGDDQPHPELFDLVVVSLEALDEARLPAWGLVAFEVAALSGFGAAPRFDACAGCGRMPVAESSRFAPAGGGLLCPVCAPGWGASDLALKRATLKALSALAEAGAGPEALGRAHHLPEAEDLVAEAREALRRFTEHLLGRPLKSRALLDRMDP
jgi:DNA repair protein RecO (recombination protein O)